jgi:hypothetical protein
MDIETHVKSAVIRPHVGRTPIWLHPVLDLAKAVNLLNRQIVSAHINWYRPDWSTRCSRPASPVVVRGRFEAARGSRQESTHPRGTAQARGDRVSHPRDSHR